ncbi:MAG: YbaN family protein [Bacteroides sp.]|nr:YbaN family protein [Bacteroides sp.]
MAGGIVSLALGLLGIPLPLLPTTPFLLLSAWFFARSSERFYQWLLNHRYFGKNIRNYRNKGGVSLGVKIWAIALLWTTILFSVICVVSQWWVRGILLVIAIGVTIHIGLLKTIRSGQHED